MDKSSEYELMKLQDNGNIHISFSEFSKYKSCGHRHLIEKYLKLTEDVPSIHLIFGNAIHKSIEIGLKEKSDVEKRVLVFREDFYKEMMDKMYDTPEYNLINEFLEQGENIVRYLSTEKIMLKYDIIGVEYALYENLFDKYFFKGFIDLIVRDKKTGKYVIIDWKTSGEEWDVSKKKKDMIFMSQMRFYKYFFSKKENISIEDIECKYVVLNRLKNKRYPNEGFGKLQPVLIEADNEDIDFSLKMLLETINSIHIKKIFPKAKLNKRTSECRYCPFKNNTGMCDSQSDQYVQFLTEHNKI